MHFSFFTFHSFLPRLDSKETHLLDALFLANGECCRANRYYADNGFRTDASDYCVFGLRTLFFSIVDSYIINCKTEEKSDMENYSFLSADVCIDLYSYRIPSGPRAYFYSDFHGTFLLFLGCRRTDGHNGTESEKT